MHDYLLKWSTLYFQRAKFQNPKVRESSKFNDVWREGYTFFPSKIMTITMAVYSKYFTKMNGIQNLIFQLRSSFPRE